MKKYIFLTVFILLFNPGCSKNETEKQLYGNWEIIGISGGFYGFSTPRNFDTFILKASGNYSVLYKNSEIQGGTYEIKTKDPITINNKIYNSFIYFTESFNYDNFANFYTQFPKLIIFNNNDSLTLADYDIVEGYMYHFIRK